VPTAKYTARANALVEAMDIALALALHGAMPRAHRKAYATHVGLLERMALSPAPRFATLASLAHLEADFFTYWNEATGKHVEKFWREVGKRGLPFERTNVVGDVLARARINTRLEYDVVLDALSTKLPVGKQRTLTKLVGDFEKRAGRR
jgi:hypothetical protein